MGRAGRIGWRCAAAAAATAWALLSGAPAQAQPEDAELVYCLSPAQAQPLRDAAVALGADRAKVTDLAAWRRSDTEAFDKACTALFEAQKSPPKDALDNLLPFLTGLFGAVATYVATAWQARVTAGRADRDALVQAATAFHTAAREYLGAYAGTRDDKDLNTAHAALSARLLRVVSDHPRWPAARRAHTAITSGALSPQALEADSRGAGDPRLARLGELEVDCARVGGGLATPGRWHRSLRRDPDRPAQVEGTGTGDRGGSGGGSGGGGRA
ncbi:hypothetical protein [Actinokineospora bangkokensis]|uniref:hypothetical protein n=1 Tax=Actinokineospora bangkokensis TaxID=1193682 RepID=UPI00117830D9|nr:hypothetical protein [Actinokineospora bangkokensis]